MDLFFGGGGPGGGMGFGGGHRGMMMGGARVFETQYQCFSTAMAGRTNIDEGDKILLPPSALDALARMNVEYPMLFELRNDAIGKKTHCGVMEFSAEEGRCYMPFWMMQNMVLEEGQLISVKNVSLAKATFVKFRAQSCDFLEISNHRAVLEVTLRKFTCLTENDQICIQHLGKLYYLDVREVKPNGAASIIETDCNVDFEEPVGLKAWEEAKAQERAANGGGGYAGNEAKSTSGGVINTRPLQRARAVTEEQEATAKNAFKPFAGSAKRIDGRQISTTAEGKDSKDDGSSSSSSNGSGSKGAGASYGGTGSGYGSTTVSASIETTGPVYQSRIGDKFSKKKAVLNAIRDPMQKFAGEAHKLTAENSSVSNGSSSGTNGSSGSGGSFPSGGGQKLGGGGGGGGVFPGGGRSLGGSTTGHK